MGKSRDARRLFLGVAAICIVLFGLLGLLTLEARDWKLAEARGEAQNLARTLDQHASRAFDAVSSALQITGELTAKGHFDMLGWSATQAFLRARADTLKQIQSIVLFDAEGDSIATAQGAPRGAISAGTRDYFVAHRWKRSDELFIGSPIRSRQTGNMLIPVSRGIWDADGRFLGVVAAVLAPSFFERFYADLNLDSGGRIMLLRDDGIVLVRSAEGGEAIARRIAGIALERPGNGDIDDDPTAEGGQDRVGSYVAGSSYPLLVSVDFSRDRVLEPWRDFAKVAVGASFVLIAMLALLASRLASEVRRHSLALQDLDARTRQLTTANAAHEDARMTLEAIFQNTGTGISISDAEGRYVRVNQAYEAMYGYAPGELVGKSVALVLPPEALARRHENFARAVRGEITPTLREWTVRHSDGHQFPVFGVSSIITDKSGARLRLVSVADISQLKATEERLRRTEERLQDAIESMADGILLWDEHDRLVMYNSAAQKLAPFLLAGSPIGRRFEDLLRTALYAGGSPHAIGREEEEIRRRVEKRCNPGEPFEMRVVSGWRRVVERRTSEGGLVTLVSDISDYHDLNEALDKARTVAEEAFAEAERANRAKSDFLASISHEIRTPLNGILGFTDLVLASALDDEQQRYLTHVRSAGTALLALISDILDFSKIEAGRIEIESVVVDLPALVRDCVALVRPVADAKGLAIACTIDALQPRWVTGDATHIRQTLLNLLNNAVKFTDQGSVALTVTAGAGTDDGRVLFTVEDTGVGIAEDRLPLLFQRFSQVGDRARRAQGTGLGLAISRALVELMGGSIGVDSKPGIGSRFWFALPLAPAEAVASAEASTAYRPCTRGARILVADDVVMNRELIRSILAAGGHRLTMVENGEQAVQAALAERFDMILMDIQMPVMDGVDACREIRRREGPGRRVPIIAITADASEAEAARARAAGMDQHLTKPLPIKRLLELVDLYSAEAVGRTLQDQESLAQG